MQVKPANFPGRKLRRQQRAFLRIPVIYRDDGSATAHPKRQHEFAVLHGKLLTGTDGRGQIVEQPTDVRMRLGKEKRK